MKAGKLEFDLERTGFVVGLLGCLLLIAGIACIYWPAGLIVAGLLLLTWSFMAARATAFAKFEASRQNKDG
jgi:uncharacterized membrane protein HdeD (DUF308 family)